MEPYERDSIEIVRFLEALRGASTEIPAAVTSYWQMATSACKLEPPNWDRATGICRSMLNVLGALRNGEGNLRQVEEAHGQVSILLGATHLGQQQSAKASLSFSGAASRLRDWRHLALESLAYFGLALTRKQDEKWLAALEAAQKALDTLQYLPFGERSTYTDRLRQRIEEEIDDIAEVSTREAAEAPAKLIPIPVVRGIEAGRGVIATEDIRDYILLDENHYHGASFAVTVDRNNLRSDGIFAGDVALIRQQPVVEQGEIAAVVIRTPSGTRSTLAPYHYEERIDIRHWFLGSSSLEDAHWVAIPSNSNRAAIEALYREEVRSGRLRGRIEYFEGAELITVGQHVGLVR